MITYSEAREIAADYQSPGSHGKGFATFASTGAVSHALVDDVNRETREAREKADGPRMADMRALRTWLKERGVGGLND